MRRAGEKGQALRVRTGRYSRVLQQILSCLRLQKAEQKLLRDFPGVKPRLAAIEHRGSEVRVADAQPFRFFEEGESNYLLPVG